MYTRMAGVSRNLEFTGVMHRAYFQTSLDRIAGSQPAGPLKVLADAVESLGLGTGRTGRPTGVMPLNRFVDACQPESELVRGMEIAAKRFVANPSSDAADQAMLRREFETWVANDPQFQTLAQDNKLLVEVTPLSKDLAALGEAGIKLLDYLSVPAAPAPGVKPKKLSKKAKKAAEEAAAAKAEWLAKEKTELARLAAPPKRGSPPLPGDVRLAAYRPVQVLVNAVGQ
jgi:hexosaminidase